MSEEAERPQASATVQVDNERVRVTEYRFAPGAETGWHQHAWDYVVVPQTDGQLALVGPDGATSEATLSQGLSYYRQAGVEHNVVNAGDRELVFIEIEMKAHPIPN
jgi:quercetin dioxygenase-like cupin family protein